MTNRSMTRQQTSSPSAPRLSRPRPERVCVEISRDKLLELLRERQLCAADFTCLDGESKHCVWRLMLIACGRS